MPVSLSWRNPSPCFLPCLSYAPALSVPLPFLCRSLTCALSFFPPALSVIFPCILPYLAHAFTLPVPLSCLCPCLHISSLACACATLLPFYDTSSMLACCEQYNCFSMTSSRLEIQHFKMGRLLKISLFSSHLSQNISKRRGDSVKRLLGIFLLHGLAVTPKRV